MNGLKLFLIAAVLSGCGGSSTSGTSTDSQNFSSDNTPADVISQCMNEADKEMLTRVNNARSRAQLCGDQYFPAAASLAWNCTLSAVANRHNQDMGNTNFFSHTGSDGLTSANRVTNAGYVWRAVGENIAAGQPTVVSVVSAWMDSPGHCSNIMSPAYTEIGAASYEVTGADFTVYWTQNFAAPLN